ncbi:tRNA wybutosine-synthesizing protein 3 homolog [Cololabis saira]|uniref:tRNA wybutosine-synthesizing protein 3 homolog n=1 Tax=Cololabis saira TaxID=129043 RepID=UPI002AD236E7|nr:tRNA wybutosine-synthesizing protein 3 homolog [Cololabis saira]
MDQTFLRWKVRTLTRLDLSRKGSVDQDVVPLVDLINRTEPFFTTSSCSGRIILTEPNPDSGQVILTEPNHGVQKQNLVWLLVSHQKVSAEDLVSGLGRSTGDAVLKFEPLVLHIQCRRLEDAQLMHSVAVNSGFRNSGLTVGKTGKIITAVRSTHGLEVPLTRDGRLLVGPEYVHFLVQAANQKLEENRRRIQRFYQNLQAALAPGPGQGPEPGTGPETGPEDRNFTQVYQRRRRRGRQTDCKQGDGGRQADRNHGEGGCELDMEDCLDLFS